MTGLSEADVVPDPIGQFLAWHAEAGLAPEVAVATASADGVPSVRMVLLKSVDERGFAFFTNYGSVKAHDLIANPRAALLFFWAPDRQVRVSGPASLVEPEESDAYWRSRPRGSQLGAWASRQSEVIEDRAVLERRLAEALARFPEQVPRPAFWGGFRIVPETIEFWHHRDDRLHDRLRYRRDGEGWVIERLSP
ncbi:MAG TPA: pyridoxamine 5'-phosphate oxidase [Acidimicrobiales bacterium]|nr:pyridoxamine 5'-phosphate oxidase [Acidimicrobiales bacterium]